jgi:hypothetical protein
MEQKTEERINYICDEENCSGEVRTKGIERNSDNQFQCVCSECGKEYFFSHGYPVYIPKVYRSMEEFYTGNSRDDDYED